MKKVVPMPPTRQWLVESTHLVEERRVRDINAKVLQTESQSHVISSVVS